MSEIRMSAEVEHLLRAAIVTHTRSAACCLNQAREVLALEQHPDEANPWIAAIWRATHEAEAATHAAALTQIGCTLALLEAHDVSIASLVEVSQQAAGMFEDEITRDEGDTEG